MSNEEEKLDKFLRNIIADVEVKTPSIDYTKQVMLKVAAIDKSSQKVKVTVISLGVLIYMGLATLIYYFFQSSLADSVKEYFVELSDNLPAALSLQNLTLIVGGFALYLIIVRLVLAVVVLRQKQARVQYY